MTWARVGAIRPGPEDGNGMTSHQHVIYGLYLPDQVDVILYAGSWCAATVDERLRQHHAGECRTTTKMAAKQGIDPKHLRMRILVYWTSGVELSPEGKIIFALQAQGQSRWNSPHAFSTEDSRRGARKLNETWGKSAAAHEMHVRNGHLFARRTNQTWGKTPEAHQAEAIWALSLTPFLPTMQNSTCFLSQLFIT